MLKIFNSLTRKIEEFVPLNPPMVGVYACGPTVYDYIHIGNLRSFAFYDFLRNVLEQDGFKVKFVQNITDIEDKIIKRSQEKGISPKELTEEYTRYFLEDLIKLNINLPDVAPKATEHIGGMIKFIEELLKKELAYIEKDGSVYFDISKFPNYGKLSQIEKRHLKTGTRTLSDNYSKEDIQDFALWKTVEANEFGWDSPWPARNAEHSDARRQAFGHADGGLAGGGKGRPGWHIECSVMSQEYLGETLDIHLGGIDLLFPHHENEIAQSEGKTGKPFAKYFIHGEHLLADGQKMSKSLKNFYTLRDIEQKGYDPLSLRYLFLTAHYRSVLNFTWESLEAAQNALNNLREIIRSWDEPKIGCAQFEQDFFEALNNDLNTSQALAVMWEMVKSDYPTSAKAQSILKMDQILGLKLDEYLGRKVEIPEKVQKLIEQREEVRKAGNFEESDKLRNKLRDLGFEVEDTPTGPVIKTKTHI